MRYVPFSSSKQAFTIYISIGVLPADFPDFIRIFLAIPFVNTHTHPLVTGPVFFTHPLDLQSFPVDETVADKDEFSTIAPVGAPSINLEVKLVDVNDEAVEGGADPRGEVNEISSFLTAITNYLSCRLPFGALLLPLP